MASSLYFREYYLRNREKLKAVARKYYAQNREKCKRASRRYWASNRLAGSVRRKIWAESKVGRASILKARKKTRATVHYRVKQGLRRRLHKALDGRVKSASTIELLGCSVTEFKTHLAALFRPGMTWENYGIWHVDHIKACAKFDLSLPAQQKICFHYSNLQPLWALDNIRKGAR